MNICHKLWGSFGKSSPIVCTEQDPLPEGQDCLLCLDTNRGFAGGINAALRQILHWKNCQAVWLLNNDALPQPSALTAMCAALNEEPSAGLCGSTVVYAAMPDTVQCAGGGYCNGWLGTTHLACDGLALSLLAETQIRDLHFILGASCLVRREVFEQCGLLPEEYFLYYEEVDFALRARARGFGCTWARDSVVLHEEGSSTGARGSNGRAVVRPPWVDYLVIRNRIFLMRRYFRARLPVALCSLVLVCLRRLQRGQGSRIPLLLKAAWHGLCGCMGRPAQTVFDYRGA